MSIAEFPGPLAVRDDYGPGAGPGRVPPQDEEAEQSVLGAMLLSKDAIADVVEVVRGSDFYRPAHELIYDAVLDLYGRGEPVDAITVSAELTRAGDLARVGGAPYVHTLVAGVPVAANAGYYAGIVREKAILRRLVDAGTKIVQIGYAAEGQVDDVVDRAQAEVYSVTDRRASEDYAPLSDLMELTIDELEAIGNRDGAMAGVPTGFAELDDLTNGLHAGQMVIVAARPAVGKALALDTPLPTPTGWTTMDEVRLGDELIGADGKPTRVVAATDVMVDRPCYRLEFSDGTTIVADAEHQWVTTTRASRRAASEHRAPRFAFAEALRMHVDQLISYGATEDHRVTTAELVEELGPEFRNVIHRVAHVVRPCGRDDRVSSGPVRTYTWHSPVYSKRDLMMTLRDHLASPLGYATAATHRACSTTEQLAASVLCADGRANHAVENAQPLALAEGNLRVPPYTLGAWLGDGHTASARLTSDDPEIPLMIEAEGIVVQPHENRLFSLKMPQRPPELRSCLVCGTSFVPRTSQVRTCGRSCGGRVRLVAAPVSPALCPECGKRTTGFAQCQACRNEHATVQARLRSIGVLGNKHIPQDYLRGSVAQRRALLAGLLDTDGTVTSGGSVQFCVTNERLASDTFELIVSLGYRCQLTTRKVKGRRPETSVAYMLCFSTTDDVFRLPRKALLHRKRSSGATSRIGRRFITSVARIDSVPVRCVQVDNASHLYLASRSMIPTHNSTLGLDIARSASIRHGLTSVIFSLEMSRTEITMRLLSAEARIPLNHMRNGKMSDDDWNKLVRKMGEVSEAPLFIDDSPNLTMMEIRAKARRLKQRHDLRLIIVDYLQLMTSGKKVESRQLEVSEFSRQIKLLAKELEVPVVAISQLNRGSEQRTSKRPLLSDLRESGSLEQDSDMVILLHREDIYEKESTRPGEADLIVAKHRNGPTADLVLAFQGHYSRFVDMAHN
ncbi:MAG: replicative DNA helicase [Nocardioidaceae bacterium]